MREEGGEGRKGTGREEGTEKKQGKENAVEQIAEGEGEALFSIPVAISLCTIISAISPQFTFSHIPLHYYLSHLSLSSIPSLISLVSSPSPNLTLQHPLTPSHSEASPHPLSLCSITSPSLTLQHPFSYLPLPYLFNYHTQHAESFL